MRKLILIVASATIIGSLIPAMAAECTSNKDIEASRSRWATLRKQSVASTYSEKDCRGYAASFYETVKVRQATTRCLDGERNLALLDSEINALNDLLAKCGT
jgi:hypothetical protein